MQAELLTLHVLTSQRITPNMVRVTVGGGDIDSFEYRGSDQWFRLFLPVGGDASLQKVPNKLTTLSYLKFLTVSKSERPILRNYTVRAYRADGESGAEIDIDFVVHGTEADGTAGPATVWAQSCQPGDALGLLDEGTTFEPPADVTTFRLVADETALPAMAGVLAELPAESTGIAWIEIPHADDQQPLDHPAGVDVRWLVRTDHAATPGQAALEAVQAEPAVTERFFGWVAGEQSLAAGARRHWVQHGAVKTDIQFTGYWKAGKAH